ncbi:aminotransferase class III family protein [Didymella exigua CBS 183.55]|uniref:Aminotransferase class III family protein n=1 Tax=Didymella exigua CBS 183.55 TaxID=1150837 RepID=A0A6A5R6N5_9PLEO|nr:aminotransferase class III family protein [Didymella exigua CBS 183.55]KAF1923243.1 aminotransferase class III family protein [Didymella exigua CBS 183.55]
MARRASRPSTFPKRTYLFNRSVRSAPLRIKRASAQTLHLENGWNVLDASGGAAVTGIGHLNARVEQAMIKTIQSGLSYVSSMMFDTDVTENFARFLVTSTDGKMSKAVFYSSGTEANEAAYKLALQYHATEKANTEPTRTIFIARDRSYHGTTLGALDMGGHKARRELWERVLPHNTHHISPCYSYRNLQATESKAEYVTRLKNELEEKIKELGPQNVAAFICEPVVGAALGCVPAEAGYLAAMRDVCDRYGVLLIFDEVMCGMGRTGYLHAWQKDGVAPDIQTVGKGLAGGFQQLSATLVSPKVNDAFELGPGSGAFSHGHTFQNYPLACAAGLEVQKIIQEENMLQNVKTKGNRLFKLFKKRLGEHPNVGDIRGAGLFWGIEFVKDKQTKEPFPADMKLNFKIYEKGLAPPYEVHVYPGGGTVDGINGDHIIISPSYNITDAEIDAVVDRVGRLVEDFFHTLDVPSVPSTP